MKNKPYLIIPITVVLGFLTACPSPVAVKDSPTTNKSTKTNSSDNNIVAKNNNYVLKNNRLYTKNNHEIKKIFYFESDSYEIPNRYKRLILAHAKFLSANKTIKIRIEGHADERGSREYNLALGDQRARSAANLLSENGANNYQVVSFGEEKPADIGDNQFSLSRNRRVELVYISE